MSSKRSLFSKDVSISQPLISDGSQHHSGTNNLSSRHRVSGKLTPMPHKEFTEEKYTGYEYDTLTEELTPEQKEKLINDNMLSGGDTDLEHDLSSRVSEEGSTNAEENNKVDEKYRKLDEKEKLPLFTRIITEIKALLWYKHNILFVVISSQFKFILFYYSFLIFIGLLFLFLLHSLLIMRLVL